LVSLDGPEKIHDQNRGSGNFAKSIDFIQHALSLNFPVEIMYLVTPESYSYVDKIPNIVRAQCLAPLQINYITVKSKSFNQKLNFSGLSPSQIINLKKNYPSIPSKNFGCFQLSLQSDGQIYGCCESPYPIGNITDNPKIYIDKFMGSLKTCLNCFAPALSREGVGEGFCCSGCTSPTFLCGYKQELKLLDCTDVVKSFNS
jgi:sulfatase maturation enzyme AslB (radical SAM superfamily)